jgi:hypothetical protein
MIGLPDHWRRARWSIALLVVLIDLAMFQGPAVAVYKWATGAPLQLTDDTVLLVAWAVAAVPLAVSFVLAVRVLKARGQDIGWRATRWASGLFLAGVLLIGITSAIRDKH